jgi:hypothetical protein
MRAWWTPPAGGTLRYARGAWPCRGHHGLGPACIRRPSPSPSSMHSSTLLPWLPPRAPCPPPDLDIDSLPSVVLPFLATMVQRCSWAPSASPVRCFRACTSTWECSVRPVVKHTKENMARTWLRSKNGGERFCVKLTWINGFYLPYRIDKWTVVAGEWFNGNRCFLLNFCRILCTSKVMFGLLYN